VDRSKVESHVDVNTTLITIKTRVFAPISVVVTFEHLGRGKGIPSDPSFG